MKGNVCIWKLCSPTAVTAATAISWVTTSLICAPRDRTPPLRVMILPATTHPTNMHPPDSAPSAMG